jgi:RND superfamily putative drug exporter
VILFIVLFGIGTDYILFFLFRYREALRAGLDGRSAVSHAVERAGEAIASAGGAVIIAFMAMILSSLSIFRSIGPALAIAVALAVLAALTLVPALVATLGPRAIAWPSKRWMVEPNSTRFRAIGKSVAAHPVRYAVVSAGSLALLSLFALAFNPTFNFSDSSTEQTESGKALTRFEKGQPSGAADPTSVLLRSTDGQPLDDAALETYATELSSAKGVASAVLSDQTDDVAVFTVVLSDDPSSDEALANVKGPVRDTAHSSAPEGTEAFVGGTTSIFVDLNKAMARDYSVVFPVAAVLIMIILALLLRSLVAPVYLMLSVGLGFTASLGATVLLFQFLLDEQGLIFILPIYIYLFVVALGTDYNILMAARLREEAREGLESRPGAAKAIEHAGPTVAAAGLILAGTFASLMFAEGTFFKSMGFSFSIGIALAAFVMALFLTPALTALLGHAAWWPGHGDRARETVEDRPEERVLET